MTNAITLSGSIRKGSYNQLLQNYVGHMLEAAGVEVTKLNLGDYPMPIFDEDLEAEHTPQAAMELAQMFAAADIVFIASPEYNSGVSPLIINAVSWISRQKLGQFKHAVFGLGAVSSGKYGAIVGIYHLRDTLLKVGALVAPTLLGVGPAETAFDENGVPVEAGIRKKVDQLVKELTHFSRGGV